MQVLQEKQLCLFMNSNFRCLRKLSIFVRTWFGSWRVTVLYLIQYLLVHGGFTFMYVSQKQQKIKSIPKLNNLDHVTMFTNWCLSIYTVEDWLTWTSYKSGHNSQPATLNLFSFARSLFLSRLVQMPWHGNKILGNYVVYMHNNSND